MKYLLFIVILLNALKSNAQVFKLRTVQTCIVKTTNDGEYVSSSPWKDANILVVISMDDSKFSIFAEKQVQYDIAKAMEAPKVEDNDDQWFRWSCVDDDGKKCVIRQVIYKDKSYGFTSALYVDYVDYTIVYRLKPNR